MSDLPEPRPADNPPGREPDPMTVVPYQYPSGPRPSLLGGFFRWLLRTAFLVSLAVNVLLLILLAGTLGDGSTTLRERYRSGGPGGADKIAVIRVDGVLMEGTTDYAQKQIEQAAADNHVKAVVIRINSPGGSITASDDLHRLLRELRDGNPARGYGSKHLIVSMGSVAASGGYYIAMPAERLLAERTTITGSIGVYAAFPNVAELATQHGITLNIIKAGEVKDSGSMFKKMSPQEHQLWQDMVDHAYDQFLAVVEEGRPGLKGKLRDVVIDKEIPVPANAGAVKGPVDAREAHARYIRRRADGGIYTAEAAQHFGLIDQIGYLDDAIMEARKAAGVGEEYKVITYDRPQSFMNSLLGVHAPDPALLQLDPARLSAGASPRLWYLAPESELAGLLAAMKSAS